jgi:DNA-binding IclR family transcriptional regulator
MNTDVINSIDRALDIFNLLYIKQRDMGVTEISKELGIYKSTIHRTLYTLERKGFIQHNEETGKYGLGIKFYTIGMSLGERLPIRHIVKPYAVALSEEYGEVVNVSILDTTTYKYPKSVLIVKEEKPGQMITVNPKLGSVSDCLNAAVGKCLLAYADEGLIDKLKNDENYLISENHLESWDQVSEMLEDVRKKGYALDNEEAEIGLTCLAAPILDKNNKAVAAISISGPTSRISSMEKYENILNSVINVAKRISEKL